MTPKELRQQMLMQKKLLFGPTGNMTMLVPRGSGKTAILYDTETSDIRDRAPEAPVTFEAETSRFEGLPLYAKVAFANFLKIAGGIDGDLKVYQYRVNREFVYVTAATEEDFQNPVDRRTHRRMYRMTREEAQFVCHLQYALFDATPNTLSEFLHYAAMNLDTKMYVSRIRQPFYMAAWLRYRPAFDIFEYVQGEIKKDFDAFHAEAIRCGIDTTLDLEKQLPEEVLKADQERERGRTREVQERADQNRKQKQADWEAKLHTLSSSRLLDKLAPKEKTIEPKIWVMCFSSVTVRVHIGDKQVDIPSDRPICLTDQVTYEQIKDSETLRLFLERKIVRIVDPPEEKEYEEIRGN